MDAFEAGQQLSWFLAQSFVWNFNPSYIVQGIAK